MSRATTWAQRVGPTARACPMSGRRPRRRRGLDSLARGGDHGRPMFARAAARRARKPAIALLLVILPFAGCGRGGRDAGPAKVAFDPDSVPDAYRGSTAALIWPGATRAFQVR